jgi:hypothetical protein
LNSKEEGKEIDCSLYDEQRAGSQIMRKRGRRGIVLRMMSRGQGSLNPKEEGEVCTVLLIVNHNKNIHRYHSRPSRPWESWG